jgi:hypothetical protein
MRLPAIRKKKKARELEAEAEAAAELQKPKGHEKQQQKAPRKQTRQDKMLWIKKGDRDRKGASEMTSNAASGMEGNAASEMRNGMTPLENRGHISAVDRSARAGQKYTRPQNKAQNRPAVIR